MGRRRAKIIAPFLLIIFISLGLVIWNLAKMQQALHYERVATLGRLAENQETAEPQLIEAFNAEGTEQDYTRGNELEAKYGMSTRQTGFEQLIQRFALRNLLIIVGTFLVLICLVIWNLRKQRKLQEQAANLEDQYQTEKSQYEVLLQRTQQEDGQIKSSITDIAHQLKTPVASLKLSMDIALSDKYSSAERQDFSEQALIQINKLDLMLDGLAKISQMETDLIQINPQNYSLKELTKEAINSVIIKAIEKDIEIELTEIVDADIFIDHKWTLEAISNVLENAIKYSPANTTIQVTGKVLTTYVVVEIMDQGPGISAAEQNKIYQRFYRGKNSEAVDGSGVGLYLTRKIVEEQGGTIMVKNRQPTGANFQMTFPLAH
ncbi:sensor histidine kinase [Enterococcus sp. 669A]|uniref:histidine kinase n=1 Tax=Candidatus Enterococcus moelleringii TaxID=2815325 RepID=A0ABS3L5V7_9ENTE|nr:ATP-binding protein [Enterococcus sp. 669A]MBO1305002.1 sensor histidine kinase [Enterococcus sp. 669A]